MQVGNLDAAERKAREAQKLAPEAPDALVLLAGIDERRGRTPQAGESFRRAAELAPQRGDILNNYGAWLCQQGRPAESLVWPMPADAHWMPASLNVPNATFARR
ncbi:hypothetical protein G6F54_014076 [Rhizopus delemar]|nr:hypothetical protein G6F54_014076 [Rhizopus delemar]